MLVPFSPVTVQIDLRGAARGTGPSPFCTGVPFPAGQLSDAGEIGVRVGDRLIADVQTRVLQKWGDGSVRWALVTWLQPGEVSSPGAVQLVHSRVERNERAQVDADWGQGGGGEGVSLTWMASAGGLPIRSRIVDSDDQSYVGRSDGLRTVESGAVDSCSRTDLSHRGSSGDAFPLHSWCSVRLYHGLSVAVFRVTVRNPQPADHPGGNWDLGNGGSVFLTDWSLEFTLPESFENAAVTAACEPVVTHSAARSMKVFQASSGGGNWRSTNHIDKDREVPLAFRGYQLELDGVRHDGLRATPQVVLAGESATFAVAMRRFWENFPKAIEVSGRTVRLALFPREAGYLHEIQGGEQKTYEFAVYFGDRTDHPPLDWYLNPARPRLDPEYYAETGAIPYLTPRRDDPNEKHHALVDSAIEGGDSFFAKREQIDEYGWRNFGDVYGDHEAVFHKGDSPLISHYNNQYDCTGGFAVQYLRTGDRRWWDLMVPMADHAWDIDTYHTDQDKLLYNGGLFWHTYHYADAHTSTHRSYPKQLRVSQSFDEGQDLSELGETGEKLSKNYAVGGGPAASHNYSTGWMLAYYLTGKDRYKEAAINAANYVIRIEDGSQTPFRWLSRQATGYSTCSGEGYYGPGRASANSTLALLTGHELSGDSKYLDRAALLMRRTVHPKQDLDALDLLNAELRWFYTMHLQSLGRFVDYKMSLGQLDDDFRYGVATLRHYARWMARHERPILSEPDRLQYPTETWAAQDMRKWQVLEHAARYESDDSERKRMWDKADFFYNYSVDYLTKSPTKALCRPVVLMLNFGWQRDWMLEHRVDPAFTEPIDDEFGNPSSFVPQRAVAIKRFKMVLVIGAVGVVAVLFLAAAWFIGRG